MGRLVVNEFVTLDGVAQAPGGPDEDRDGGFEHGGWHMQYMDEVAGRWVDKYLTEAGSFLFGRRTYQTFAAYWPNASEEERWIADLLGNKPKYVVSTTLREPFEWKNSILLKGDLAEAVVALKQANEKEIHVIGSTQLVHALTDNNLVDEFRLMIDPVIVGGGKRVFPEGGRLVPLRLVQNAVTSTGALLLSYVPSGQDS